MLLISSLFIAGCTTTTPEAPVNTPTPSVTPTDNNFFTSIKDAVTRNMVLKCEYVDADGSKTMTYIHGSSVRMVGADEKTKNVNGLIKDKKFYVWELNGKEGMIIDMTKIDDNNPLKMGETAVKSEEDVISVLEGQKDKCVVSPVDASFLELPQDVVFKEFGGW